MSSAEPVRHPVDFASRIIRGETEVVVAVEGQIDLATVPLLWGSFQEATSDVSTRVIIDVSATTFIDSTGMAVFLMAHKRLRDKGAELVLRSPTPPVRRVLQMAGLDKILVVE
jgi:anti-sigma B factor antagonist